jgi:hypothetical protein
LTEKGSNFTEVVLIAQLRQNGEAQTRDASRRGQGALVRVFCKHLQFINLVSIKITTDLF